MTVRQMIGHLSKLDPDGVLFIRYSDTYEFMHVDTIDVPFESSPRVDSDEIDSALSKIIRAGTATRFYKIDSKGD